MSKIKITLYNEDNTKTEFLFASANDPNFLELIDKLKEGEKDYKLEKGSLAIYSTACAYMKGGNNG